MGRRRSHKARHAGEVVLHNECQRDPRIEFASGGLVSNYGDASRLRANPLERIEKTAVIGTIGVRLDQHDPITHDPSNLTAPTHP